MATKKKHKKNVLKQQKKHAAKKHVFYISKYCTLYGKLAMLHI